VQTSIDDGGPCVELVGDVLYSRPMWLDINHRPDFGPPKICQIVPTRSIGISSGNAMITTRRRPSQPFARIESATTIPSGTVDRGGHRGENRLRHSDAKNRSPRSVDGSSNSLNQPTTVPEKLIVFRSACIE